MVEPNITCCGPMVMAQQEGTDGEGWSPLIGCLRPFGIGLCPDIKYCPWCGTCVNPQVRYIKKEKAYGTWWETSEVT